ncbi:kinase-like domain-containing protein, partial [Pelagophyceae sp. CCMP2097]
MPRSPASASPVLADYDVVGVLGCGSFGSVSRVRRKTDGAEFACKSVPYGGMAEKHKHLLVSEVNIMRTLRHAHIVKYVDRINDRDTGTLHIIMELCPGGDLASLLKRQRAKRRGLDERAVWQLVGQVAAALRDCHEGCFSSEVDGAAPKKPVLHRDLKPANILFDGRGDVKVADFGLAIELKNAAALAQTCLGTPLYMAPEVVKQQPYGPPADVWSLGCVAYEACALEPPFCADTMAALNADIVAGRLRKPLPRTYSPALRKLVSAMLNSDAAARP